jgi:HK97 family phage prohead protease
MERITETKTVRAEVKAGKEKGIFTAKFSVVGNVDDGGDRIMPGSWAAAFEENAAPPVVWSHQWGTPPIGVTLDAAEKDGGAVATARLFMDEHPLSAPIYAGLRDGAIREFSFGYTATETKDVEEDRQKIREIHKHSVYEWGPTLVGMNRETELLGLKSLLVDATGKDGALVAYVRDAIAAKSAAELDELAGPLYVCTACGAHQKAKPPATAHAAPDGKHCPSVREWKGFALTPIAADGTKTISDANDEKLRKRQELLGDLFT